MNGINKYEQKTTLSICIPTWNRAKYLDESLSKLHNQLKDINIKDIEIYISDNASIDDTPLIVQKYIDQGMPITYNRNIENIGAARNFIHCIKHSNGKYIWLLGDDDFLKEDALKLLIKVLKENECGLLHLCNHPQVETPILINDLRFFLKEVSFYITFMSGNIFNKDIINEIKDPEQYVSSHLLQVPYYLEAACKHKQNSLVNINQILEPPADASNNGGYNFFEVFVKFYLEIWKEKLVKYNLIDLYSFIRKDIYVRFSINYVIRLLILKKEKPQKNSHNRKGWDTKGGWSLLLQYYGKDFYFYKETILEIFRRCINKVFLKLKIK
ncbi:glycosyltransferase family 2 protein [Phocaeicola plebeius]|uniref:glycosyltransferase family 2 protein n=1 Tax=Phocaeicola plebeius TaxID=310297 RepID=UPI003F9AE87B